MSKINLSEWLDSRGVFKDVEFGDVSLQIVSLSKDLIAQLKALNTYKSMFEFVAEHGLSHNRNRLSSDEDLYEDVPVIWAMTEFEESKCDIVEAICELSDITGVLTDQKEKEEAVDGDGEFSGTATLGGVTDGTQTVNV